MTFEIINNLIPKEQFKNIKNFVLNPNFSWNLTSLV